MTGFTAEEPWHDPPGDVVPDTYAVGTGAASNESRLDDDEPDGWDPMVTALVICGAVALASLAALVTVVAMIR